MYKSGWKMAGDRGLAVHQRLELQRRLDETLAELRKFPAPSGA